jgi:hypothetical protein
MAWVRLDDQFPDHPGMINLSNDAFRVYLASVCDCARHNTNEISWQRARWLCWNSDTKKSLAISISLCDAGLWERRHDSGLIRFLLLPSPLWSIDRATRNYAYLQHRDAVFARDNYQCVTCGSRQNLTLDHIVPVSLGGSGDIANLQTMCRSCNSRKGARLL